VSRLGYVPMCITLALLVGLAPAMLTVTRRGVGAGTLAWLGPLIWAAAEVFRGEVFFTGYPWLLAAHPLIEAPGIPHLASVVGVYGVSALALVPICLAMAPGRSVIRAARAVGACGLIVAAGFAAGALAPPASDRAVRIAIIQTNIPQDNKTIWAIEDRVRDMQRFLQLTERAAAGQPDLIVWPETMFPGLTLEPGSLRSARAVRFGQRAQLPGEPWIEWASFADALTEAQARLDIPMLVGAIALEGLRTDPVDYTAQYNSVFVIAGGQIAPQRYDKVHLTPFGEVMPYISNFPALEQALMDFAAAGMSFALSRGADAHGLAVPIDGRPLHIATPICFEAASGPTTRRLAAEPRADLLVNITNDGWFGDFDPARLQAAQIARWRAIELATPMVRAANTGASGGFDTRGRPVAGRFEPEGARLRSEGILTLEVRTGARRPTLFARAGWAAPWVLLAAAAGAVVWGVVGSHRTRRREPTKQ
jgi:apolipoprotein N-acyltransferase